MRFFFRPGGLRNIRAATSGGQGDDNISRETAIAPAQRKAKVAAGKWLVYLRRAASPIRRRQRRLGVARRENAL